MKAIILAAGRGSRMKELTDDKPKCLVELKGKALLEWQLEAIRKAGIDEIGIVTGYKREMLASMGLQEFYNERWAETQMVSSLACAEEWLERDACIVSYSDIFYESSAVEFLMNSESDLAITYDPNWLDQWSSRFNDPLDDAETFKINDKAELIEIGNKPTSLDQVNGQFMGLIRISPNGWFNMKKFIDAMDEGSRDSLHLTKVLSEVARINEIKIKALTYLDKWSEVDSESDLTFAERR